MTAATPTKRQTKRSFRVRATKTRFAPVAGRVLTTRLLSNRNNTAFKISRNSMKINSEPNSNRNTNQGIAAVASTVSICNNDLLSPRNP